MKKLFVIFALLIACFQATASTSDVYCSTKNTTTIWSEPNKGSDILGYGLYDGEFITGVEKVNDEWYKLSYDGQIAGYVLATAIKIASPAQLAGNPEIKTCINRPEVERYAEWEAEAEAEAAQKIEQMNFRVFNGWKAGKYGLWLIIIPSLLLLVLTIKQWGWKEPLRGVWFKAYGWLLALIALLQVWYFTTLGIGDTAWFLDSDQAGKYTLFNFILFVLIGCHQGFAIFTYAFDIQINYQFRFKQKWTVPGAVVALILWGTWWMYRWMDEPYAILQWRHEVVVMLCVAVAMLPQTIAMIVAYFRGALPPKRSSIFGIAAIYLLGLVGAVSMATFTIGVLVAIALMILAMYALIRTLPSSMYNAMQDMLNSSDMSNMDNLNREIENLTNLFNSGTVTDNPGMAQRLDDLIDKRDRML